MCDNPTIFGQLYPALGHGVSSLLMDLEAEGGDLCCLGIIEGVAGSVEVIREVKSSTLAKEGELADIAVLDLHATESCSWLS